MKNMPTFVCYCVFKSHYIMTTSSYNEFGWRDAQPMFYHKLLGKYIERLLPTDGSPILDVGWERLLRLRHRRIRTRHSDRQQDEGRGKFEPVFRL
jgi:hypothetical protein